MAQNQINSVFSREWNPFAKIVTELFMVHITLICGSVVKTTHTGQLNFLLRLALG